MICGQGYAFYSGGKCNESSVNYDPEYCNAISGYYTPHNEGYLEPLTVNKLWSRACMSQDKQGFCDSLVDESGTPIENKPSVCGGSGPDILMYSPTEAAIYNSQEDMAILKGEYDKNDRSKQIIAVALIIALAIILIAFLWN